MIIRYRLSNVFSVMVTKGGNIDKSKSPVWGDFLSMTALDAIYFSLNLGC